MTIKVLIAHAKSEEELAEQLAAPIRVAGYEVAHEGTVLVGESVVVEASKLLSEGAPVILCGTVRAVGTKWGRQVVTAARRHAGVRIFVVQMEEDADVDMVSFDEAIARYWQDTEKATEDLIAALKKYYPLDADSRQILQHTDLETRYRDLLLKTYDIVDLAEMGDDDRHLATQDLKIRRLYVALRMRLEIQADDEVTDATLKALEQRRAAGWDWQNQESGEDKNKVSLGARLEKARRVVVLGDPGAGKSTLLRWLTTAYLLRLKNDPDWRDLPDITTLPKQDWLPILIRCRDLPPDSSGILDDMLRHSLRKAQLSETECDALRELLRSKLEQGQALLLVDGLDEITDPAARVRFAKDLEKIHLFFPDAPIVVTSRIVGYREMGYRIRSGFEHLTVADLSKADKDEFAQRWCELTEKSKPVAEAAADLMRDIHSSDRIERLTGNPMLLTTMALIKRKIGRLPQRRVDLYNKAVEVLLNWRREVDTPLDPREALPQLEYLAHALCERGVQQVREDEVLEYLCQARAEYPNIHTLQQHSPEAFLRLLESRTGLLIQSGHVRHNGHSVPVYEFRHLTFQEYLAGTALVQGHYHNRDKDKSLAEVIAPLAGLVKEIKTKVYGRTEFAVVENWREALRLCLAACNDDAVDAALSAILHPLEGETNTARARAVQAALCLADEPNVSAAVARAVVQTLAVQVGVGDGLGNNRTSLDAAAMELADSRWAGDLSECLLDDFFRHEVDKRSYSGGLYAMVRTAQAPTEESTFTAWLSTQAECLLDCNERETAALALTVMSLAFHGKNCQVPGMTDALIQKLSGGVALSHAAAFALYWLNGGHGKEREPVWHPTPEQLVQLLAVAANPACDSEALHFLTLIFKNERTALAVDALLLHLPQVPTNTRRSIIQALGKIGDARAVDALLQCLQDAQEDKDLRWAAAYALGQIGDARAVDALLPCLQDAQEDKDLRQEAAKALGQIGDTRAVEALLPCLQDAQENKDRRQAVAYALGQIGDARAVDTLLQCLQNAQEDKDLRRAAAYALGQIGDARAVDALLQCLQDVQKDEDLWRAAAYALGQIGDARGLAVLRSYWQDEDEDLRRAALQGLAQSCEDELDRTLLSRDLDAVAPGLDPQAIISPSRIERAAQELEKPPEAIKQRYEVLAQRFGLKLGWKPSSA